METERHPQDPNSRRQERLSRIALLGPLEVAANFAVEQDGVEVLRLRGDGDLLQVNLPGRHVALALARQSRFTSAARRRALARCCELLAAMGLQVEVRVATHLVARVGAGARGGALARLACLPGFDIRLLGIVKALISP